VPDGVGVGVRAGVAVAAGLGVAAGVLVGVAPLLGPGVAPADGGGPPHAVSSARARSPAEDLRKGGRTPGTLPEVNFQCERVDSCPT